VAHADHTVALLQSLLGPRPLQRVLNTHLHSDHCGGNRALQAHWPGVSTAIPVGTWDAVQAWDEDRLSYRLTQQRCDRFAADARLVPGDTHELAGHAWEVHATPGHDPDAVVLFQRQHRVLISGDALWRRRVAVLFPELDEQAGFQPALDALDLIESLDPAVVIPGHGEPFDEVADALAISRSRLRALQADPSAHARHASRVLLMFHMMEHRQRPLERMRHWLADTPLMQKAGVQRLLGQSAQQASTAILEGLLRDGALVQDGEWVRLP